MPRTSTKTKPATPKSGTAAKKSKVTLEVRIETIDAQTGTVALFRDFTAADPVRVTVGTGAKQPKNSLWYALRDLADVWLVGRAVGDTFEQTYPTPWGAYDPKKVKTFTGKEMKDLLRDWKLKSWKDAVAGIGNLFVHHAWAQGTVVAVDADKIVLDANGHAGKHLKVTGKILSIAPK